MELPKLSGTQLALGAGIIGVGAGVAGAAIVRRRRKKSGRRKATRRKTVRKKVRRGKKLKFGSKAYRKKYLNHGRKQRKPHTAGKRTDTSKRRIRYTKNNQPYIILANGRARFISKKSASSSRKRSGGRY